MAVVGYARVSSRGQSLAVQEEQLRAAGVEKLFAEKASGTSTAGRPQLGHALDYVREGDTFVVTRIDRLARSVADLDRIVRHLRAKGVQFRATQQGEFDTSSPTGKLMMGLLGLIAEFETELRAERQAEGIQRVKETGRTKTGRKYGRPSVDPAPILALKAEGVSATEIARRLRVARSTVYAALGAPKEPDG